VVVFDARRGGGRVLKTDFVEKKEKFFPKKGKFVVDTTGLQR
jgi:hypothetical protein